MAMALKVVGWQKAKAKEMADAGYIEINPDMAHELRMFQQANDSCLVRVCSENQRKREIEAGIFTWVKLEDLEAYYVAQQDWVHANRINNLIHSRAKKPVVATVAVHSGGVAGSSQTLSAAPGTNVKVSVSDGPQHRSSDVHPEPPLDWKGEAKKFDPFKDFVVESGNNEPPRYKNNSGPLGKSFQPPSANGKSSWPGAKW